MISDAVACFCFFIFFAFAFFFRRFFLEEREEADDGDRCDARDSDSGVDSVMVVADQLILSPLLSGVMSAMGL